MNSPRFTGIAVPKGKGGAKKHQPAQVVNGGDGTTDPAAQDKAERMKTDAALVEAKCPQ